jgi:hypothetical protein
MTAEQRAPGGTAAMATLPARTREEANLRERLGEFRALLVISLLMTESVNEEQILELAASSAPGSARGASRVTASPTAGGGRPGTGPAAAVTGNLSGQLAALGSRGGRVSSARPRVGVGLSAAGRQRPARPPGRVLRPGAVRRGTVPDPGRRPADRGGRVQRPAARQGARHPAAELAVTNAALAETVTSLQRSMDIHERLTRVAVSGEGQPGIARALHELTGMPVAIEDRYGNLSAWAGPGQPSPYPKESFAKREHLLRRLMRDSKPVRDGERLILLASPRNDVIGVLALVDPGGGPTTPTWWPSSTVRP